MYNRYIPEDTDYIPVDHGGEGAPEAGVPPEQARGGPVSRPESRPEGGGLGTGRPGPGTQSIFGPGGMRLPSFLTGKDGLSSLLAGLSGKDGKEGRGLSSLLKTLKLGELDTGDILLLLIVLFLLVEGDDLELVIALGLVLIMGLGDDKKKEDAT